MRSRAQLDALEQRITTLAARRDAVRARERKRERAEDLRRKILLGALVLARWAPGPVPEDWRRALDQYLTRPRDRALFGLAAHDAPSAATALPATNDDGRPE
jgi:hypothetical protein